MPSRGRVASGISSRSPSRRRESAATSATRRYARQGVPKLRVSASRHGHRTRAAMRIVGAHCRADTGPFRQSFAIAHPSAIDKHENRYSSNRRVRKIARTRVHQAEILAAKNGTAPSFSRLSDFAATAPLVSKTAGSPCIQAQRRSNSEPTPSRRDAAQVERILRMQLAPPCSVSMYSQMTFTEQRRSPSPVSDSSTGIAGGEISEQSGLLARSISIRSKERLS